MYLIIDKATKAVLHMSNSSPVLERTPQDLLPGFDEATMAFGVAPGLHIPVRFDVVDRVVVDLDAPAPAAESAQPGGGAGRGTGLAGTAAATDTPASPLADETLSQARERRRAELSGQALALRAALAPDYQLLNAGLGVYDDARTQTLRATVNAFRDEVNRVEAAMQKARSVADVNALTPNFPTALVVPKAAAAAAVAAPQPAAAVPPAPAAAAAASASPAAPSPPPPPPAKPPTPAPAPAKSVKPK